MYFIEPFIWMFSAENFKKHFCKLLIFAAICWGLATILFFLGTIACDFLVNTLIWILFAILLVSPFLCLTGYFWYLTDNITVRKTELKANVVYNGKLGSQNVITLPEWNVPRFIWRGIASIIATIIMYIPFVIVMFSVGLNIGIISSFWELNPDQITTIVIVFVVLFSLLVPGLLWNYARRDSILAVLNIPKAVYLMEAYPLKYFFNSILMLVFSFLRSLIVRLLMVTFGLGAIFMSTITPESYLQFLDLHIISTCVIIFVTSFIIDAYWSFVYAYLLGTIAPPNEY